MLIYHPAFDAYHAAFRMIAISERVQRLEIDKARILDFYLLFPFAISSIKLPDQLKGFRKEAKKLANPFHDPMDRRSTFRDMRYIQEVALKCIAAADVIRIQDFTSGHVVRSGVNLSKEMHHRVRGFLDEREPASTFVLEKLSTIDLLGAGGLKDRTGLMEYRYDAVEADAES